MPPERPIERTVVLQDESLKQFEGGFTSIPNRILANNGLSLGARMTYAMLLKYAWQKDFCFPAQERIAQDLGITDRSVRTFLGELKEHQLIEWKQQGLNRPNIYYVKRLPSLSPNGGGPPPRSGKIFRSGPEGISAQERKQASDKEYSREQDTINVQRSNVSKSPTLEENDPLATVLANRRLTPQARAAYDAYKRQRAAGAQPPHAPPSGRRPTEGLTDEQIGIALGLQEELADTLGEAKKNAGFYRLLALDAERQGYADILFQCLSETKAGDVPRGTVGSRSAYFTKVLRAKAAARGVRLPIRAGRSAKP